MMTGYTDHSICSQVFGVKGPSWLSVVPEYDVISGMSTDYIHCVLLGVCRLFLRLWFQSSNHKEPWYIGDQVAAIDDRLCSINPPSEIQWTPQTIAMTVKFWKGQGVGISYRCS